MRWRHDRGGLWGRKRSKKRKGSISFITPGIRWLFALVDQPQPGVGLYQLERLKSREKKRLAALKRADPV